MRIGELICMYMDMHEEGEIQKNENEHIYDSKMSIYDSPKCQKSNLHLVFAK